MLFSFSLSARLPSPMSQSALVFSQYDQRPLSRHFPITPPPPLFHRNPICYCILSTIKIDSSFSCLVSITSNILSISVSLCDDRGARFCCWVRALQLYRDMFRTWSLELGCIEATRVRGCIISEIVIVLPGEVLPPK